MKNALALITLATLLGGCETMFAHIRLTEQKLDQIARANAVTNFCLANNAVNRNMAYAFSNVSAQLLDITVIDRDYYKERYQATIAEVQQYTNGKQTPELRRFCMELEKELPSMIENVAQIYMSASTQLHAARTQERMQMATTLGNFGRNWAQQSYSTSTPIHSYPNINFVETKPESVNYLVNTSKGLIQCRVTSKNYVFCI